MIKMTGIQKARKREVLILRVLPPISLLTFNLISNSPPRDINLANYPGTFQKQAYNPATIPLLWSDRRYGQYPSPYRAIYILRANRLFLSASSDRGQALLSNGPQTCTDLRSPSSFHPPETHRTWFS